MLMAWVEPVQLVERFTTVAGFLKQMFPHWKLGSSYEGFVKALAQAPELVGQITQRLRRQMQSLERGQRSGRWQAYAVDGSQLAAPRTVENQQAMGGKGQLDGMPLVSLTVLYDLQGGLPWAFRVGPGSESERAHLKSMLPELPNRALLVADAGFVGYEFCRGLMAADQHFLLRVGGNIQLLESLGYRYEIAGQTVYLWPQDQQQQQQPPLKFRLIVLQKPDRQPVYLVTSVLVSDQLTDEEAGQFYRQRWEIEVFYRTTKQTLQHHRLRSRTPENCYQELTWIMLGVWLLKLMTLDKLIAAGHPPQDLSPARARNIVRRVIHNQRPCPRSTCALSLLLAGCRKDNYVRLGPKATRSYPRKKRHQSPGPPKIKPPTPKQIQQAKHLTPQTIAA
jgi:Transposase DDE domain